MFSEIQALAGIAARVTSHVVDSRNCSLYAHCGEGEVREVRRRNARVRLRHPRL
jgi:hypothetical protein